MVGYSEKLISMKILIIGPSPYMHHDPGLIVRDILEQASVDHALYGCFFHHDFSKHPVDHVQNYVHGEVSVPSKWIDNSQANAAVIDTYDCIMDNEIEAVISVGSTMESEFIRAAIETSGKSLPWFHVMSISNHMHDDRYSETLNAISHIWTYSESQKENIQSKCGVLEDNISVLSRRSELLSQSNSEKKCDLVFGGWNTESYNLRSIFEAASLTTSSVKCLTNYFEHGDFDLNKMGNYFFPKINLFPSDFASLFEKPSFSQWDDFIENSYVFVDMSMTQNGCSTLKRAWKSGAQCVVIDTPRHREMASQMPGIILVKSSVFFSLSGIKLYVPDHLLLNLILSDILQDKHTKVCKPSISNESKEKEQKEFSNLLNKLIRIASLGRFLDLESIT